MLQFSQAFVRSVTFVLIAALACPWQVARAGPEEELRAQFEALPAEQRQGMTFESAREEVRQIAILIRRMEALQRPTEPAVDHGTPGPYRLASDPRLYPISVGELRTAIFDRFTNWLGDHPEYSRVAASRNNVQGFWRAAAEAGGTAAAMMVVIGPMVRSSYGANASEFAAKFASIALILCVGAGLATGNSTAASEIKHARESGAQFFQETPMGQWITQALALDGATPPEVTTNVTPTSRRETLGSFLRGMRITQGAVLTIPYLALWLTTKGLERLRARVDAGIGRRSAPIDPAAMPTATQETLLAPLRIAPTETQIQDNESPDALFDRAVRAFLEHYQATANSNDALEVAQRICPVFTIEHAQAALNADPGDAVGSARRSR